MGGKQTVLSAAANHCANWILGGRCLGISFEIPESGPIRQGYARGRTADPEQQCLLREDERCRYFERSVLPAARHTKGMVGLDTAYAVMTKQGLAADAAGVRQCECGEVLRPRQRYCNRCAKQRRKAGTRRAVGKLRCKQLTAENGKAGALVQTYPKGGHKSLSGKG